MKVMGFGVLCTLAHGLLWVLTLMPVNLQASCYPFVSQSFQNEAAMPAAANDTFLLAAGCGNNQVSGNLLINDSFLPDSAWISHIEYPETGNFSCGPLGDFIYKNTINFRGEITLNYRLSCISNPEYYAEAQLTIFVEDDNDCDNVVNSIDVDDDNDGILDVHEGDQSVDSDNDGIPDCYDIDSDNDGITDFTEWQTEGQCASLLLCDNNCDGWDDAFDPAEGGMYYEQVDTDRDGIPDFLDTDSDNDGISDFIEAFDVLNNGEPELKMQNLDYDGDGLDNSCDTLNRELSMRNPMGSCSPLPDHNQNNIRDWRDPINYRAETDPQDAKTAENGLLIFPNPVLDYCTIKIPAEAHHSEVPYSLKIFDSKGTLIQLELLYQEEHHLPLSHLKGGIYIIRVKAGATSWTTRISKIN